MKMHFFKTSQNAQLSPNQKQKNKNNLQNIVFLLPGCISAGTGCLSEPLGPGELVPPPSVGTEIHTHITVGQ